MESHSEEETLQERLGYSFENNDLLATALTHRSAAYERAVAESYERLEFLGDAVLGLATTEWLYLRYSGLDEGDLTLLKSRLVSSEALAEHATGLGIGPCLRLGQGEERSGGRRKRSLLADALEAVLGAIFLDGGFEAARRIIWTLLEAASIEIDEPLPLLEAKNRLQELLQSGGAALPEYVVRAESGPDHEKSFEVEVRIDDAVRGVGVGSSKKSAEQRAAMAAFDDLDRSR